MKYKINILRLKSCRSNCLECIKNLEDAFTTVEEHQEEELLVKYAKQAFRGYFVEFQTIVEEYVAICLKSISVSISDSHFIDKLQECVKNGFISEEFTERFKIAIKFRNSISHRYKMPSTEELLTYFEKNRDLYYLFLEDMDKLLKLDDNCSIKKSSGFN